MPIPSLRSTGGPRSDFYCSACNTKMAIQEEWDNHLSSVHPRHWEREKKERATRQASRKLSATRWRVTIAFSVLGFAVTCLYVVYLWVSYPQRNLRLTSIFDVLCPPSSLTLIYIDVPGTTADYAVTWIEVALLNAGLYGFVGAALSRLLRRPSST
jgi:hypothetical protein